MTNCHDGSSQGAVARVVVAVVVISLAYVSETAGLAHHGLPHPEDYFSQRSGHAMYEEDNNSELSSAGERVDVASSPVWLSSAAHWAGVPSDLGPSNVWQGWGSTSPAFQSVKETVRETATGSDPFQLQQFPLGQDDGKQYKRQVSPQDYEPPLASTPFQLPEGLRQQQQHSFGPNAGFGESPTFQSFHQPNERDHQQLPIARFRAYGTQDDEEEKALRQKQSSQLSFNFPNHFQQDTANFQIPNFELQSSQVFGSPSAEVEPKTSFEVPRYEPQSSYRAQSHPSPINSYHVPNDEVKVTGTRFADFNNNFPVNMHFSGNDDSVKLTQEYNTKENFRSPQSVPLDFERPVRHSPSQYYDQELRSQTREAEKDNNELVYHRRPTYSNGESIRGVGVGVSSVGNVGEAFYPSSLQPTPPQAANAAPFVVGQTQTDPSSLYDQNKALGDQQLDQEFRDYTQHAYSDRERGVDTRERFAEQSAGDRDHKYEQVNYRDPIQRVYQRQPEHQETDYGTNYGAVEAYQGGFSSERFDPKEFAERDAQVRPPGVEDDIDGDDRNEELRMNYGHIDAASEAQDPDEDDEGYYVPRESRTEETVGNDDDMEEKEDMKSLYRQLELKRMQQDADGQVGHNPRHQEQQLRFRQRTGKRYAYPWRRGLKRQY